MNNGNFTDEAKIPGARLKALRDMIGMTRADFAEILEITPRRLKAIESGERRMNESDFYHLGVNFPWALRFVVYAGPMEQRTENGTWEPLPPPTPLTKEDIKQERETLREMASQLQKRIDEGTAKRFPVEENSSDQDLQSVAVTLANIALRMAEREPDEGEGNGS